MRARNHLPLRRILDDTDRRRTAIQPHTPRFSAQTLESTAAATAFDQITAGGVVVQYADLQAIQGRQNLVLPTSTSGVGVHIRSSYVALATILGIYHPFMLNMRALLDDWVSAKMELLGLLAPIPNGAVACVFWMALRFYCYFHSARMQLGHGQPVPPDMTELTEQLKLHVFAQMAPPIPACYLPAGCLGQPGPWVNGDDTPNRGTRVQNPHPNAAFQAYDKAGRLGPAVAKHPAPAHTNRKPICLSSITSGTPATATAPEPPTTGRN